jgi:uncharacterized RDD family membrane protein YckC
MPPAPEGSNPARPPAPIGEGRAPADAAGTTPGFLLRLSAMTYEAVLLFGLVFVVSFPLLSLTGWTYPLAPGQRWILQTTLFIAIGLYFVHSWTRSGQTLAMKSWRLRLVDGNGRLLRAGRAALRYLLAWSLFAPGLAFAALTSAGIAVDLLALLIGVVAMMALARLDPRGQLLHDRLLGSRVIRD